MPDPIDDLLKGLSETDIKKKYRLSDDDLLNLNGVNYLMKEKGYDKSKALDLYPELNRFMKQPEPAKKEPAAATLPTKQGSVLPAYKPERAATDNTRAIVPMVKEQAAEDQINRQSASDAGAQILARQQQSGQQEIVKQNTEVSAELQRKPIAAPSPKDTAEEIKKKNQNIADVFYATDAGKAFYRGVQPVFESLVKAGGGMIAGTARLAKNPRILPDEVNRGIDQFADAVTNYFDFDGVAKSDRADAFLYAKPEPLQGALIGKDITAAQTTERALPAVAAALTNIATLVGGGAGKLGLVTRSYLTTVEQYRKDAEKEGVKGKQLDDYSNGAAVTTSLLELVSPNNPIVGKINQTMMKEAVRDIVKGVAAKEAVKRALKTTVKEVGKENLQELSQNLGDILVKEANDKYADGAKFNQDLSYETLRDQALETILITSLVTPLAMAPGTFRNYQPSNQVKQSLQTAAQDLEGFNQSINAQVQAGTFTPAQAETIKENLNKYSTLTKQIKQTGVSDAQASRIAWESYKSGKLDEATKAISNNPALNNTIGEEAKKEQQTIQENIRDAMAGIPETGTEITGEEMASLATSVPNAPSTIAEDVKGKDYRVTEIDLQEKYESDPSFREAVEQAKPSDDTEGLRNPPIIDAESNIIDGTKRLAQQYANGNKTTRVYQELTKGDPTAWQNRVTGYNQENDEDPIELIDTENGNPETSKAALFQSQNGDYSIQLSNGSFLNNPGKRSTSFDTREDAWNEYEKKENSTKPPLSGITTDEQQAIISKRKAKTNLSDRQNKINSLLQDADTYNATPEGRLGKGKPEGVAKLNELKLRAEELNLSYDPIRNTFKTASGGKVQKRFLAESNQAITENHTPVNQRPAPVRNLVKSLYKASGKDNAALFFPNTVTGIDGKTLNPAQLTATLNDVFDGVPSVQTENYLNELEKMVADGNVLLTNEGQEISIPIDEYLQQVRKAQFEVDQSISEGISPEPDEVTARWVPMIIDDFDSFDINDNLQQDETGRETENNTEQSAADLSRAEQTSGTEADTSNEGDLSQDDSERLIQEDQDYDTPLTNREQAKKIADKLRAFASAIEVKGDGAFSRPDILIRNGILSPALKLTAKAIEAGGSIADGIKAAVDYVKSKLPEADETLIREEIVNTLVDAGIQPPKKRTGIKRDIITTTSTRVKDKVIESELSALKRQIKDRYRNLAKGAAIGKAKMKQAQAVTAKEIAALRASIGLMLEDAEKRKVFTGTTRASVVSSLAKKLAKAKTANDLDNAITHVAKVINNVEYDNDLNRANSTKQTIAKTIKSKAMERAASNVGAVKAFLKINPADVADLKEYNRIATRILETQRAAAVKLSEGKAVVKHETFEINNAEIKAYTEQELKHAEELAKQRLADRYQDLVDIGVIDPATMSFEELQAITQAINEGGETVDEKLDRLKAEEAEKQNALTRMVEYQQIGLQDHYNQAQNTYEPEEQRIIESLMTVDASTLSTKQKVKINDVINNIVINNEFFGSGELAAISDVIRDNKTLAEKIKASGIVLSKIKTALAANFSSVQLTFDFITKSSKLAGEIQRLSGIAGIFQGNARATIKQDQAINEYDELKKKAGRDSDSAENRYTRGMYARVIQHLGGTAEDVQKEFDRVKGLIKQTYERLQSSEVSAEQKEGALVKKVYDQMLSNANNAQEVEANMSQANKAMVNFWINKFGETVNRSESSAEIYNNKVFDRFNNYTATAAKGYNNGSISQEQADVFAQNFLASKLDNSPARTKLSRTKGESLAKNMVLDLDFDYVQAKRHFETLYDIETAPAIAKVRAFFETPETASLLGGSKNLEIVRENIRNAVLAQKQKQLPVGKWEKAVTNLANRMQLKGARIALGSIFQLPKQYLSVAASTVINLAENGNLFFKAFAIPNNIELFNLSSIGTRGDTKAGYDKSTDIAAISRSSFANAGAQTLTAINEAAEKVTDLVMKTLVKSDESVARTSWLAYYMRDLQRQGIDINAIDWKEAHKDFNDEAAVYAEQMVSRTQNPNNSSEFASVYRDSKGYGSMFKNIVLPFSTFAVNQRGRMTNDLQKIFRGGDKDEAIKSLLATTVEVMVFNAIKIYLLGRITTWASREMAELFGMWSEKDEKAAKKYEDIEVTRTGDITYSTTSEHKKFRANSMNDLLFSGIGNGGQYVTNLALNKFYSLTAIEKYPNGGKTNKSPDLIFSYDPSKNGEPNLQFLGSYAITPLALIKLGTQLPEVVTGKSEFVSHGGTADKVVTRTVKLIPEERLLYIFNFVIDAGALIGVSDAEVTSMNRKLESIRDKQMKVRYGGETTLTIFKKGKATPIEVESDEEELEEEKQ